MRQRRTKGSDMAENKTKETKASVESFLNAIEDTRKQNLVVYIMPGLTSFRR